MANKVVEFLKRHRTYPVYTVVSGVVGAIGGAIGGAIYSGGDPGAIIAGADLGGGVGIFTGALTGHYVNNVRNERSHLKSENSFMITPAEDIEHLARDMEKQDDYRNSMKLFKAAGELYKKQGESTKAYLSYLDSITLAPFQAARKIRTAFV